VRLFRIAVGVTHVADRRRLLELVNRVRQAANKGKDGSSAPGAVSAGAAADGKSTPQPSSEGDAASRAAPRPHRAAPQLPATASQDRSDEPIVAAGAVEAKLRSALEGFDASPADVSSFCEHLLRHPNAAAVAATPSSVRVFFRRW